MPSPPCLGEVPQYLDGYETQEAAGFRKQGGEVIRVDNEHLCGKDQLHVRVKMSPWGTAEGRSQLSQLRGADAQPNAGLPCRALPPLLSQTPQRAMGSPKWNQMPFRPGISG